MKNLGGISVLIVSGMLFGCATSSSSIATSYVSPAAYQPYDCEQLVRESDRIRTRVVELGGRLDDAAKNDKILTGVGLFLFWPSLLLLGGNSEQEHEFAKLKGDADAVNSALIAKRCGMSTGAQ